MIIKKRKGIATIEMLILVFVFTALIVLALRLTPVFIMKSKLDNLSRDALRYAEMTGEKNIVSRVNMISNSLGIKGVSVNIKAVTLDGVKIQLGSDIEITAQTTYKMSFLSWFSFNVPITSKVRGQSEVYWK